MKWSVIVLLVLGVVAAIAAALLTASLRAQPPIAAAERQAEARIVVTARALEANHVVQADDLAVRSVPPSQVTRGYLADPSFAVGKSLRTAVAEGQAVTAASFMPEGSARDLASRALTTGKRAKTVALTDDAALEGLLYAGCMVDVLWCYKGEANKTQPMSKTLLENVPVLAIGRQTVLSEKAGEAPAEGAGTHTTKQLVTLLLDPQQAAAVQLAMDHGGISLVMRNPADADPVTIPPVSLQALARDYFPILAAEDSSAWVQKFRELTQSINARFAQLAGQLRAPATQPLAGRAWEMVVIRGAKVQVESVGEAMAQIAQR